MKAKCGGLEIKINNKNNGHIKDLRKILHRLWDTI